jgi:hypothetical protein
VPPGERVKRRSLLAAAKADLVDASKSAVYPQLEFGDDIDNDDEKVQKLHKSATEFSSTNSFI